MPRHANLAALLAAVAPALAILSDGVYTETVGGQEVGRTTIDGSMVYSMNYCSIVHSTHCYTSLSTGGPAPSSSAAPPVPTYGQPGDGNSSGSSVPTPGTVSGSGEIPPPATSTPVVSSGSVPGGEATTTASGGSSTATSQTPDVPTGAAVMGASAVVGNVVVAALAALVV